MGRLFITVSMLLAVFVALMAFGEPPQTPSSDSVAARAFKPGAGTTLLGTLTAPFAPRVHLVPAANVLVAHRTIAVPAQGHDNQVLDLVLGQSQGQGVVIRLNCSEPKACPRTMCLSHSGTVLPGCDTDIASSTKGSLIVPHGGGTLDLDPIGGPVTILSR
jgi:hypothetical protein